MTDNPETPFNRGPRKSASIKQELYSSSKNIYKNYIVKLLISMVKP